METSFIETSFIWSRQPNTSCFCFPIERYPTAEVIPGPLFPIHLTVDVHSRNRLLVIWFVMVDRPFQILVVEDNEGSRELLGEMLGVLGHEAYCVPNAESAMQCFGEGKFGVLLADINLPGMSGIDLASHLTTRSSDLKVIFASGYGYLIADRMDFDFILLPKPYSLYQLEHALDAVRQLPCAAIRQN